MSSDKNAEIAVKKCIPKFLSILTILNERAQQYRAAKPAQKEIEKRVPEELMKMVYDFNSGLLKGISPEQEGFEDELDERFNKYMRKMGADSLDIAEAIADPSLERVDMIVKDISQILARYLGVNPFPVLKNQLPFCIISSSGNLEDDERLDRRAADVAHVLAKESKTLEDISKMPIEDILKIREQVQKRSKTIEPREFYEQKIGEKYAQYMLNLTKQTTPEKAIPEIDELFKVIQDNLPQDIPDSKREEALEYLKKGGLNEIASLQAKIMALKAAEQFVYCAVDMTYIDAIRELAQLKGIDVEIDGKQHHISPSDYIELSKKDLNNLKKLKDYLVDVAMEKGLDGAVTPERINEAIRFTYSGDKAAFVAHQKARQKIEYVLVQSILQEKRIPPQEFTTNSIHKCALMAIDRQIDNSAKSLFGE